MEPEYAFGENAHGPDISFFSPGKDHLLDRKRRVQSFVPDMAVEVVSGNDSAYLLVRKVNRYRQYGTSEVWIFFIEPREVHLYSEAGDRILRVGDDFISRVIPGFMIGIADLYDQA